MKILIADDEKLVRYSLVSILENLGLPDLEIIEAENGRELVEKVVKFQPDGGFVDIRMPGVSGLDALDKLKKERAEFYAHTTWFLLTGFADFEFARKAITVDVENYLLKPVSAEEVRASVDTIRRNNKKITAESRKKREAALVRLINQNAADGEMRDFAEFSFHRVILLAGDCFHESHEIFERNRYIRRVFAKLADTEVKYTLFFLKDERTIYFMESSFEKDFFNDDLLSYLKNGLKESRWLPVTLLVSGIYPNIHSVINDLGRMESLIRNRHLVKAGDVRILKPDILEEMAGADLGKFIDDLFTACSVKSEELIDRVIMSKPDIEINEGKKDILIENLKKLFAVSGEVSSVDEIITKIVKKYRYPVGEQKISLIVQRTLEIVDEHYSEAIGINEISDMLSVSPNYLSSLFKKEMKVSFTRYLTVKRLEVSRKLLLEDGVSVKKAAQRVGYMSEKHFSRLFKKYYAVSPSTFRSKSY